MSALEWRQALEQLGATQVDFGTGTDDLSTLDDERILLISARVP